MSGQLEYFVVSRVWFKIGSVGGDMHVPDRPQYHHGLFFQTRRDRSGVLHHVTGDVVQQNGMPYDASPRRDITTSATFDSQQVLGYVAKASYTQAAQLLQNCQRPPQQKAFNTQRMAHEPFKTQQPLTWYTSDELKNFQYPRLRKCKWWVEEQAIPALQTSRLLLQNNPSAPQQSSSHAGSAAGNGRDQASSSGGGHGSGQAAARVGANGRGQTSSSGRGNGGATSSGWVWDASKRKYRCWNGRGWIWQ